MKEPKNFVVIGAGSMGAQIGALAAASGYNVKIRDIEDRYIQRGKSIINSLYSRLVMRGVITESRRKDIMARIEFLTDLDLAVGNADFITESVPENLSLKQMVFREVSERCPKDAILATNTSSLSISEIAKASLRPELVVGTHYFNPPSRMTLLEIVRGEKTKDNTIAIAEHVAKMMQRDVIHVKDVPGFLVNRIWIMMESEADWALAQGEATNMSQVDSAIKYKLGLPMGMFEIIDTLEGGVVDTMHHIMEYFQKTLGESFGPPPFLNKAYKIGRYGKRTKGGYYDWDAGKTNEIQMSEGKNFDPIRVLAPAVNEAAKLIEQNMTTKEDVDRGMILGVNYPRGILRMADSYGIDRIVKEMIRLKEKYKVDRYNVSSILTALVNQGKLGRKSGEGFFKYDRNSYEFIKLDIDSKTKVARIIFDRTYRANALNLDFIGEIDKVLGVCENSDNVQCLVLTGSGYNFCAGADLSVFACGDSDEIKNFTLAGQNLLSRIELFPKPVIAAINGPALGGGFELVLACDFKIMDEKATLRFPELDLGLIPGFGGIQRIVSLVGPTRAKEILLMGEQITSKKAIDWGIVNLVVESVKFEETINRIASKLANGAPLAQRLIKSALIKNTKDNHENGVKSEFSPLSDLWSSLDLAEGITAMVNRRIPKFTGM